MNKSIHVFDYVSTATNCIRVRKYRAKTVQSWTQQREKKVNQFSIMIWLIVTQTRHITAQSYELSVMAMCVVTSPWSQFPISKNAPLTPTGSSCCLKVTHKHCMERQSHPMVRFILYRLFLRWSVSKKPSTTKWNWFYLYYWFSDIIHFRFFISPLRAMRIDCRKLRKILCWEILYLTKVSKWSDQMLIITSIIISVKKKP